MEHMPATCPSNEGEGVLSQSVVFRPVSVPQAEAALPPSQARAEAKELAASWDGRSCHSSGSLLSLSPPVDDGEDACMDSASSAAAAAAAVVGAGEGAPCCSLAYDRPHSESDPRTAAPLWTAVSIDSHVPLHQHSRSASAGALCSLLKGSTASQAQALAKPPRPLPQPAAAGGGEHMVGLVSMPPPHKAAPPLIRSLAHHPYSGDGVRRLEAPVKALPVASLDEYQADLLMADMLDSIQSSSSPPLSRKHKLSSDLPPYCTPPRKRPHTPASHDSDSDMDNAGGPDSGSGSGSGSGNTGPSSHTSLTPQLKSLTSLQMPPSVMSLSSPTRTLSAGQAFAPRTGGRVLFSHLKADCYSTDVSNVSAPSPRTPCASEPVSPWLPDPAAFASNPSVRRKSLSQMSTPRTPATPQRPMSANSPFNTGPRTLFRCPELLHTLHTLGESCDQHFERLSNVGHGGFSDVFHVRDVRTNGESALKVFYKVTEKRSRVEQMLHSVAQLGHHPHLLYHEECWVEGGHLFLRTELCTNGNLVKYLEQQPPRCTEPFVWQLLGQISSALTRLHSVGLLHKDVKPENLLVTGEGDLKLGDLQLVTADTKTPADEGDGRYLPPEALDDCASYTAASDMFALGMSAYELATGAELEQQGDFYDALRSGQVPFLEERFPLSSELKAVICALLSPKPCDRPTAAALMSLPQCAKYVRDGARKQPPVSLMEPPPRVPSFACSRKLDMVPAAQRPQQQLPPRPMPSHPGVVRPGRASSSPSRSGGAAPMCTD